MDARTLEARRQAVETALRSQVAAMGDDDYFAGDGDREETILLTAETFLAMFDAAVAFPWPINGGRQ